MLQFLAVVCASVCAIEKEAERGGGGGGGGRRCIILCGRHTALCPLSSLLRIKSAIARAERCHGEVAKRRAASHEEIE